MTTNYHVQNVFTLILISIALIFLAYTAKYIKKEYKTYQLKGNSFNLGPFKFIVPNWWSIHNKNNQDELIFTRTDTRYDWKCLFQLIPCKNRAHEFENLLIKHLQNQNILFDPQSTILQIHQLPFSNLSKNFESVRIEGTATQSEEHRLYVDIFGIKHINDNQILICQNTSSVLNGIIEGPFFEKSVLDIKYMRQFN